MLSSRTKIESVLSIHYRMLMYRIRNYDTWLNRKFWHL